MNNSIRDELISAGLLKPARPDWQNDRHHDGSPTPITAVHGKAVVRLDAAGKRAAEQHVREWQASKRPIEYRGI